MVGFGSEQTTDSTARCVGREGLRPWRSIAVSGRQSSALPHNKQVGDREQHDWRGERHPGNEQRPTAADRITEVVRMF